MCRIPTASAQEMHQCFRSTNRGNDVVPHSVETAERLDCCFEKIAEQFAIGLHDAARSFSKEIEMLKRGYAEEFTGINRCRAVKIVQAAHLPREIRLRQNPAASQTADAVNFR